MLFLDETPRGVLDLGSWPVVGFGSVSVLSLVRRWRAFVGFEQIALQYLSSHLFKVGFVCGWADDNRHSCEVFRHQPLPPPLPLSTICARAHTKDMHCKSQA